MEPIGYLNSSRVGTRNCRTVAIDPSRDTNWIFGNVEIHSFTLMLSLDSNKSTIQLVSMSTIMVPYDFLFLRAKSSMQTYLILFLFGIGVFF